MDYDTFIEELYQQECINLVEAYPWADYATLHLDDVLRNKFKVFGYIDDDIDNFYDWSDFEESIKPWDTYGDSKDYVIIGNVGEFEIDPDYIPTEIRAEFMKDFGVDDMGYLPLYGIAVKIAKKED